MINYINDFKKQKIMVIGDLILDEYIIGNVTRISPEAPVPIVQVENNDFIPGGAANVAMNIASLGGEVLLAGVTGKDQHGERLKKELSVAGVNIDAVIEEDTRTTTLKTRIIAHDQQVVRVDWENRNSVSELMRRELIVHVKKVIQNIDLIVISDYDKGVNSRDLIQEVVSIGRETNIPVFIDPKSQDFSKYSNATVLTPNKKEASVATGFVIDNNTVLEKVAELLIKKYCLESIVITLGSEGIYIKEKDEKSLYFSAYTHEVYDVTGAGDTVLATLALGVAAGASLPDAATLANVAAGISVSKLGSASVTKDELIRELEQL